MSAGACGKLGVGALSRVVSPVVASYMLVNFGIRFVILSGSALAFIALALCLYLSSSFPTSKEPVKMGEMNAKANT
jgi:hypothetical protein